MEMTWKKTLAIVAAFLIAFILPIFLLSNPMMGYYQGRIDKDPNSDFNKWLQLTVSGICYKTMRPEIALEGYEKYINRFPKEDEDYPFVLLRYAKSLEDAKRYDEAIDNYELLRATFPDHEYAEEAERGITRIKYQTPNT